ncbi:tripartite tricarboxylate transporter substrate binding protein [Aquibium sp. ELW1220]|uniref:Bug family tripartite tricarboxylate transporter substrate binding protein n=1 Tax=Aquibium sp. ELW1220 TaxID=2976766 RepID=UPI0025AFFE9C|nr:tripartite tricarboxylate transporter substrate binding protein [Aquibium sp. ELW1220]MDN2581198.1 tripartite tricarboxylate transporter substrate binding protein [Aquibium sp. ELW1220]
MSLFNRRTAMAALGLTASMVFAPMTAFAADDPIRLVIPYGGGGLIDGLVREMADTMSAELGQPVVIENKPGSNGIIGAAYVAAAKPDGLTYLVGATGPLSLNVLLRKNLPFSMESFEPVGTMFTGPLTIAVPTKMGVDSIEGLKAWGESGKPLRYAMLGPGSVTHLFGMVLQDVLGTELVPVAYKANPEMIIDQIGGQVELNFATPISLIKHVESGDLRIIAISTDKRMDQYPDLPSVTELGYPQLVSSFWFGLVAPAGTPQDEKDRVAAALQKAVSVESLQQKMINAGMTPEVGGSDAMKAQLDWDVDFWGGVISKNNISLDD